ncbi:class I SAM-dependent methyltransferase [Ancylomarina sp. 16SWW S1-10-2]|uniref:class I SAM-dependent methyltransferase n=1 Tax=Ancylomarina sp. 16SWW S1-10-2 TaxID=2499681 RepID=UPI0012AD9D07|nr:class I SAM-dependent methyltransferase [Ancylomarina sp. 16SWW S1-10-2]MRT92273.1 class I SAM-dependent methyltransferase [Ancylomarina sp. 16SWW S1-10-2]
MSDNTSPHLAETYDRQVRETLPYYDLLMNEVIDIVKIIKPQPKCWIDTGCGTGNLIDLAVKAFCDTDFLLADPSKEMMDISLNKNSKNKNVKSIGVCTTQELETIKTSTPDIITAIQCHHYLDWENRKKALEVCYNLLEDGGLFITTENISPASEAGIKYAKQKSINFQISQGRTEEESFNHSSRFGVNYFPITIETFMKLLRDCGFKVVEILWTSNTFAGFYCIK